MGYDNTPTVVVVRVPIRGGLLMVRRALPGEGQGKLALPGGYQMAGQTWREAGAREVLEETGVAVDPASLRASLDADLAQLLPVATLTRPERPAVGLVGGRGGRDGVHTEALGRMLAIMQSLARAHPGATW